MSQNTSPNQSPSNPKDLLRIAIKPFIFLLFLIMVCAFLAHYLVGSETLEEYARNNPEIAYGEASEATYGGVSDTETSDMPSAYNTPKDIVSDETDSAPTVDPKADDSVWDGTTRDVTAGDGTVGNEIAENNTIGDSLQTDGVPSDSAADLREPENMTDHAERTTYQTGFYYEPLNDNIKKKITGISYPENGCTVPYEDLNYVGLLYIDFNGEEQIGELICNKAIAQDMVEIFYELYQNGYQIERVRLIDEYDGDDTLSMMDNNTSCFNYRVVDGTTNLSKHALGCAIDINPFYNPYVVFNKDGSGETYISPKGSEVYADRAQSFPYKIDENDLCYKLFIQHGFSWGGNWNSCKDYQHFQIVL